MRSEPPLGGLDRPFSMNERLHSKVAVVTGAARGLGRAAALRLGQDGARVVVFDTREDAEKTAEELRQAGGEAIFLRVDVSDGEQVKSALYEAADRYGGIDILYANAGVQLHARDAKAADLSEEVWDLTMAINLRGMWLCCKHVLPFMLERGRGSIILAASPTGLTGGGAGYTAYSTSKAGVVGLTRVMAADYGPAGIRVNAIVPGPMNTPLIAELVQDQTARESLQRLTMLGRLGEEDEAAGLVAFLASDDASYCTGGLYMVDGGITAL